MQHIIFKGPGFDASRLKSHVSVLGLEVCVSRPLNWSCCLASASLCFSAPTGFGLVKLDLKTKSETGVVSTFFFFFFFYFLSLSSFPGRSLPIPPSRSCCMLEAAGGASNLTRAVRMQTCWAELVLPLGETLTGLHLRRGPPASLFNRCSVSMLPASAPDCLCSDLDGKKGVRAAR